MKKFPLKLKEKFTINPKQRFSLMVNYIFEHKVVFAASLLTFLSMCLHVYLDGAYFFYDFSSLFDYEYSNLSFMFFMALLIAVPVTLLTEKLHPVKKYLLQIFVPLILTALLFWAGKTYKEGIFIKLYYSGFSAAVLSFSLFLFIPKNNSRAYYANLFKRHLSCVLLSLLLLAGILFLMARFYDLMDTVEKTETYQCATAFFFYVFETNLFLYYLFKKCDEESSGRFFKVLLLYILLPLFALSIVFLYGYIIKSLILRNFHGTQVNSYISIASSVFICLYFLLKEFDESLFGRLFYRFASFALIPLIIVQAVCLVPRMYQEGLTLLNYAKLLYILFSALVLAFTFVKQGRFMKYTPVFLGFMILLASLSPLNLYNLPYKVQLSRLMSVVKKYDMYDSQAEKLNYYNKYEINEKMREKDRRRLFSSFFYLAYENKLPLPYWISNSISYYQDSHESFYDLFGFYDTKRELESKKFSDSDSHYKKPDESEYSRTKRFSVSHDNAGSGKVIIKTDFGDYDVSSYLLKITNYGRGNSGYWYFADDKVSFLFTKLDFTYYPYAERIGECSLEGYICYYR